MIAKPKLFRLLFITLLLLPPIFFIAVFTVVHNINTEVVKKQLHDIILKKYGFGIKINGHIALEVLPRLNLSASNVEVTSSSTSQPIVTIGQIKTMLNPFSLLTQHIVIDTIYLDHIDANVKVDKTNQSNIATENQDSDTPEPTPIYRFSLDANTIMIKHLNADYQNDYTKLSWSLRDASLLTKKISLSKPLDFHRPHYTHLLRDLDMIARVRAKRFDFGHRHFSDINVHAHSAFHQLQLDDIAFDIGGGHGVGKIHADFSHYVPEYRGNFRLSGIHQLPEILPTSMFTAEKSDMTLDIASIGHGFATLVNQAKGEITIHALKGAADGFSLQQILENSTLRMQQRKPLSFATKDPSTAFDHMNAQLSLAHGIITIHDLLFSDPNFTLIGHGFYNTRVNQLDLFLMMNIPTGKYRIIRNEFDQFFRTEIRDTVPAYFSGKLGDLDFMIDVNYVDPTKFVLGSSVSRFLKGYGYKPYSGSATQIKQQLKEKLDYFFNTDE